jgi:hypothetical protein
MTKTGFGGRVSVGVAILGAVAMFVMAAAAPRAQEGKAQASRPLEGAWRVVDAAGQPGPGVYIFAKTHYSMMVVSPDRPDVDAAQATADELRAMWGPIAANAGVYELEGNLLTIRPIVAKIPIVMKAGAYEVYAFTIQGDRLSPTQKRNVRGPVEGRAPTWLVRVE